ncbi:MAG: phosphatidate cytidylyltransferase [Nitrospiraceae bacterium]|nr:MAG: phosphatidate cytidylyltransferase [Nitrospiraceae bacterium]
MTEIQNRKKSGTVFKRHFVAAAFVPLFIAYLYYLPPFPWFFALLLLAMMTALWEFYAMYRVTAVLRIPGVLLGGVLFYLFCHHPPLLMNGFFITLFLLMLIRLFSAKTPSGSMTEMGPLGMGLLYVGGFLGFQWLLRMEAGMEYIFLLYASVWLADSGAFYMGTYLGRNKLYPSVSPNKTWEGAAGSVLGGVLGAVVIKTVFAMDGMSLAAATGTGVIMGIAALLGDLIESMFKRDAGVKDSGMFIPGHGGILDKLDGLLAAGPVLYLVVRYL